MTTVHTSPSYPATITINGIEDYILIQVPPGPEGTEPLEVRISRLPLHNNRFAMGVVFPGGDAYMIEERKGTVGTAPAIIVLQDENEPERIELEHWKLKKWRGWK